jgi:hypothetical protein
MSFSFFNQQGHSAFPDSSSSVRKKRKNKNEERRKKDSRRPLLQGSPQLRVLGLGLPQDGDVRIGVFPESEEVLIGVFGFGAIALDGTGACEAEMGERPDGFVG